MHRYRYYRASKAATVFWWIRTIFVLSGIGNVTGRHPLLGLGTIIVGLLLEILAEDDVEKTLLRDACADLLPAELLHRKKSPYPKTYHPGYEKLLADHLRRIISDPNAPVYPLIDPKKAEAFLAAPKELGRPWFGQLMAGPQLMAYFIQLNDWMEKYHLSV